MLKDDQIILKEVFGRIPVKHVRFRWVGCVGCAMNIVSKHKPDLRPHCPRRSDRIKVFVIKVLANLY